MSATLYDDVIEPLTNYGRPILTGEQLATVRTLLMDADDANVRLIYELRLRIPDDESGDPGDPGEPVTMAYVGELAVHAQRLREIADGLIRNANAINGMLYELSKQAADA